MLRGASAEAKAELCSRLEGLTGDAANLGEELFAVAAVLRSEAAVRRIATDASIEGDAKAGLMGNVFGNALGTRRASTWSRTPSGAAGRQRATSPT